MPLASSLWGHAGETVAGSDLWVRSDETSSDFEDLQSFAMEKKFYTTTIQHLYAEGFHSLCYKSVYLFLGDNVCFSVIHKTGLKKCVDDPPS